MQFHRFECPPPPPSFLLHLGCGKSSNYSVKRKGTPQTSARIMAAMVVVETAVEEGRCESKIVRETRYNLNSIVAIMNTDSLDRSETVKGCGGGDENKIKKLLVRIRLLLWLNLIHKWFFKILGQWKKNLNLF